MSSEYTDIIGDDQVYYSPSATDELVNDANLMYKDFKEWLDECENTDAVFDSVISPYAKGNPPADQRIKKKKAEYDSDILEAKNIFDDTLEEMINYIIDYSNNANLTLSEDVAVSDTVMTTLPEFVVEDESVVEETVVVGQIGEDSRVME